jgi:DNA-binding NtrC family response regulator
MGGPSLKDVGAGVAERRYRLRGEVGGVERSYLVAPGETRLGSVGGNDIVLAVRGVSRQHALLACGAQGVAIEDLESRNGVLVNGVRTRSARLRPGDEVRLGPVALRLEELPADDAELAIVVSPIERVVADGLPSWQTTAVSSEGIGGRGGLWLRLVDGLLERLCTVPEADLAEALVLLARELPAHGACLLERSGLDPLVLAAAGELPDLARNEPFQQFLARAAAEPSCWTLAGGDPFLAAAAVSAPGADWLALVVWGDFPGRSESEPLLRTLVKMIQRFRPREAQAVRGRTIVAARGLVFPEGYAPGESPAMASLYAQMRPLVQGDLPVLIVGETGVGKEYVARILHASSRRSRGPFVAINCAAIPAELLEAELFGIGKGVATGVVERQGKFQLASGGTLFLDEIGDMSLDLQAKLLRALQEKQIQPLGSAPVPVDIRVVAATNSELERRMDEGRFRRDLYYRVAGYLLRVPPLRERREDIPTLVEVFVRAFARDAGKSIRGVTVKALRALCDHRWPGNVRELEHEVRRLVSLCPDGEAIDSRGLSPQLSVAAVAAVPAEAAADEDSLNLELRVAMLEGQLIREALARAGGNYTQAAKLLGVSRNGLALKMQRLGITS